MRTLSVFCGVLLAAGVVEAKTVCIERQLECPAPKTTDAVRPSTLCQRYILKALEAQHGVKLESRGAGSIVQGSVSINHCPPNPPADDLLCSRLAQNGNNHRICVEIVDTPEVSPESILKELPAVPIAEAVIRSDIEAIPKAWTRMDGFEHRLEHEIAADEAEAKRKADRASGNAKLETQWKALGLTDAEIAAR